MRILAVDPGYERLGIAVIEKTPDSRKERLVYSDCFKTPSSLPHHERLRMVGGEIERVAAEFSPQALAIETLFFSTNRKTAMNVSEARGVILYAAAKCGLAIHEYSPADIKIAVSGYGRSGKQELMKMVPLLIVIDKAIRHDDEYDAIAAGLTYFAREGSRSAGRR